MLGLLGTKIIIWSCAGTPATKGFTKKDFMLQLTPDHTEKQFQRFSKTYDAFNEQMHLIGKLEFKHRYREQLEVFHTIIADQKITAKESQWWCDKVESGFQDHGHHVSEDISELDRISSFYLQGELYKAIKEISLYLKKHPEDDLAWTMKGNFLLALDLPSDAEKAYQQSLDLNPKNFRSLSGLGTIYWKEKNYDQAVQYYQKALKIKPAYAPAYTNISVIALKQNQAEKALEYARQAYYLDKQDPVIAANLAVAFHYTGDYTERDKYTRLAGQLGYKDTDFLNRIYSGEVVLQEE